MDLDKTLNKINKDREQIEAAWTFCLWEDPELYDDYKFVNEGTDETLKNEDAIFYFNLGKSLYAGGFKTFDSITVETFINDKPSIKKKYESFGGWATIKELRDLVNISNVDGYFDQICKMNSLSTIAKKYEELFNEVDRFKNASNEDIYNTFDLLNTSVSINTSHEAKIESLVITEQDIEDFDSGETVGISYAKAAPILNYTTLGLPIGDIYLLAGHSGAGKSSFAFNMAICVALSGTPVCILSNEMQIKAYKNMLLAYVLIHDLNYWKLTRKKIKLGGFSKEEKEILKKAANITSEKYGNIYFIKLFDNNSSIVMKHMKKINRSKGVMTFIWDTYKADDMSDEIWKELLMSSRKVFNLVSKENWSLILTFQLALYTTNQRYLDAGCLSSSKQIKEVVSELIMCRKLWADEYNGEKYDCKPYKLNKENNKIKEMITLDPDKTYVVCFVDKTRNDDNAKNILFQWDTVWNRWVELGFCTIINEHKGY